MHSDSRQLVFTSEENGISYFLVKPSDVSIYVEHGAADIGIVGKDILLEYEPDVYELLDLGIGKCRMCVAGMNDFQDNPDVALRVATKFVNIAKTYYKSINRDIEIIKLNGSIELAPILDLSDVIVDIVETGSTLRENGLEVLEEIYFTERVCQLDKYWENMATRASEELGMSGDWLAYLEEEIASGTAIYHVYGVSDTVWEDFTVYQGEIDLEKLYSGDYVVVNPFDNEGRLSAYEIGDKVEVFTTTGESKTCEVLAIASIPYEISVQHVHPVDINFFLPADVFLETVEKKEPMFITLDVADAAEDDMETFLTDYCEKVDPNMQYASKAVYMEEYKTTQNTYRLVGTVISVLLALIGIANFANTNITAIMTRKRELAVLESIGMTVKQQKKMLITEGCIYMLLALGVASTLGVLMGNAMLKMLLSGEYYTVTFTVMPTLVCVPILFLLAVVIPLLSRKYVNRESVIERIS